MNYIISSQFLKDIDDALQSLDKKDLSKAKQIIQQTLELGGVQSPKRLDPLLIGKLWQQECPSIVNFANTITDKLSSMD